MNKDNKLKIIKCKRCGREISTILPIINDMQGICASCCTLDEKYQILENQAKNKGYKK